MKRIFADMLFWVAMIHRKDQWHHTAVEAARDLGICQLATTDEVLVEVLAAFCETGPILRRQAAAQVRNLLQKSTVTVYSQSRDTFRAGLDRYEARLDKGYSLTDCISMNTIQREGISEVLTHDNHFTQEGFITLL